jgi:hypothetical protein
VIVIQLAAIIARLEEVDSSPSSGRVYFPQGVPNIPVWLGESDNTVTVSWENRATARTSQGQGLVAVYAELLRRRHIHTQCHHLAGRLNIVADDISRNEFSLSHSDRTLKLFKEHPILDTLDYFLPSPDLLQVLTLRLFSKHITEPCALPTVLGRFVPAGTTTSISVSL